MALSDNLIAAWELDEASGVAIDSHGTNDLTDNNTVGSGTGLIYATARDFEDGNTEYFSLADNADLSIGDNSFTFEIWFNPETVGTFIRLFNKRQGGTVNEYELYYWSGLGALIWENTNGSVIHTFNPSAATWYQAIVSYDAAANEMAVATNAGTATITSSVSPGPTDWNNPFQIGRFDAGYFDGLIGPVRFWKRALTSSERTELYNGGAGRTYAYITGGGGGLIDNTSNILHNILGMAG